MCFDSVGDAGVVRLDNLLGGGSTSDRVVRRTTETITRDTCMMLCRSMYRLTRAMPALAS